MRVMRPNRLIGLVGATERVGMLVLGFLTIVTGGIILFGGVISWAWWLDHQPWVRLRRNSSGVDAEAAQHPTSDCTDARHVPEETP